MLNQLQQVLTVTGTLVTATLMGIVSMSAISVAWADTASKEPLEPSEQSSPLSIVNHRSTHLSQDPIANVSGSINKLDAPATTVEEWIAQIEASLVQITGVRVEATETGIEIVLETADGSLEVPETRSVGNALIADIPNATLVEGEFSQADPVEGIALVSVTGLPNNRVRIAITGVNAPPTVNLSVESSGLVLAITPGTETAETSEEAIQIVVTGEQEDNYQVPNASAATRTDTPIRDIPQSIQVIPEQVWKDQGITQLGEALRNVSGISPTARTTDAFGDYFTIRGFSSGRVFLVDGFRSPFGGNNINLESANVERLEVLKGPASVLYGQAEPGGLINVVTEQPSEEPFYELEGQIGSYDFYRPSLDFSGPLNTDRTVLYRLNLAYQNSGTFVDFLDIERFFVAPVLSFQLGEDTRFVLEGQYLDNTGFADTGLPAVGTVLSNPVGEIPRSRFVGDDIGPRTRRLGSVGYRLEHGLSDRWTLRNAFRYDFLDTSGETYVFPDGLAEDNRTLNRTAYRTPEGISESYAVLTDVRGSVNSGNNVRHDLLFGLEFRRVTDASLFASAPIDPIDVFDPDYGASPGEFVLSSDSLSRQTIWGAYIQDLIRIGDNVNILLGARYDWVNQATRDALTGDYFNQQDTALTPRVGVVYQPIEPISLYASYARSFAPVEFGRRNADGTPFEPTTGEQFEVGIKTELFDDRLAATLAAYQITQQNLITPDPDRPDFSIQVGEQRSRGIELDVVGEPLLGLNLIATYTYIDAELTKDNSGNEGNQASNVPEHSASLWATYEIQDGALEGLGFGAGVFFVGKQQGDLENTFTLPSYVRTDAAIYYRRDNWQIALNAKNLFDVDYYRSSFGRNNVFYGDPFTILGTVSVTF